MIDAVLGLHTNPATCGVAKFNQLLAAKLGVPFLPLGSMARYMFPLVSLTAATHAAILRNSLASQVLATLLRSRQVAPRWLNRLRDATQMPRAILSACLSCTMEQPRGR